MGENISEMIKEIQNDRSIMNLNEASVKSVIIQRLLSLVGWNIYDANEVKPEFSIESKAVDFALRIGDRDKVFIEVKRASENLHPHQEQLLNYSFRKGVKLGILTNGVKWWFYLPLHEGGWDQRRFLTVDMLRHEPEIIAERFIELLSKDKVASGEAVKTGENLYDNPSEEGFAETNVNKELSKKGSARTVSELGLKADSFPNLKLGFRLKKILDWAFQKGILMDTGKGGMPRIRIGRGQKEQIALIRFNGEIYINLREERYSGGARERNELIVELRTIGLSLQRSPNQITDGSATEKKLDELTDAQFQNFLEILEKHCV